MEMAERIKERRLLMEFTQEELGEKLGLQKSAIAKYENGRVENIKRSVIANMAKVLDCSPAYLMGWDKLEPKGAKDYFAFIDYLKSLGYSIETDGIGKAIKDHDGSVIDAEHWKHTLTKDGTAAVFMDDEWDKFRAEIQKTVDYQVWRKAGES